MSKKIKIITQFIVIVIPTYNEKESLPKLVKQLSELDFNNWQVLIIDDNSPDGTGAIAEELSKQYPLSVIHRSSKTGLGNAYRAGFKKALTMKPDIIIQMDADLSHNPRVILKMIDKLNNHDLVIGSRYVSGGGSENWSRFRKLISQFANVITRLLLSSKIHDLTSGYKAFTYSALKGLSFEQTSSVGYNFQVEMNIMCERQGYRICEIPIIFIERKVGQSKFDIKIIIESALRVFLLAFNVIFKSK